MALFKPRYMTAAGILAAILGGDGIEIDRVQSNSGADLVLAAGHADDKVQVDDDLDVTGGLTGTTGAFSSTLSCTVLTAQQVIQTAGGFQLTGTIAQMSDNLVILSSAPGAAVDGGWLAEQYHTAWGASTEDFTATNVAGSGTSVTLTGGSAVDDAYNGYSIAITDGTGVGQQRTITDYNGTTKVATLDRALTTALDTDTTASIWATPARYKGLLYDTSTGVLAAVQSPLEYGVTEATISDYIGFHAGAITADDASAFNGGASVAGLTVTSSFTATGVNLGSTAAEIGDIFSDGFLRLGAISDPTNVAGKGFVYTKDAGAGAIELFYLDAAGNAVQITTGGSVSAGTSAAINDNDASAYSIAEGVRSYFLIDTTDDAEAMSFGNATTNPAFNFLGSGTATFSGAISAAGLTSTGDVNLSGATYVNLPAGTATQIGGSALPAAFTAANVTDLLDGSVIDYDSASNLHKHRNTYDTSYTNKSGGSMAQYECVYINSAGGLAKAVATSLAACRAVGVLDNSPSNNAAATLTKGSYTAMLAVTGLTPAVGDPVYVSKTAGRVTTDISAFTEGTDYARLVGICRGTSLYAGLEILDVEWCPEAPFIV